MDLRTDRLLLRRWRPHDPIDVEAAFDIYRRPEVARWLGASPAPWDSREVAQSRLVRWSHIARTRPGFGMWAVEPHSLGTAIGTVLLAPLPDTEGRPTDDIEIGWHLHPDHWGHGYATEAATAVLAHAFGPLGLPQVNAVAYPGNAPSVRVMGRIGLVRQGVTDRWYGTTLEWWVGRAPDA